MDALAVKTAARAALMALARSHSPVVREADVDPALDAALRRWFSYRRRNPKHIEDFEARVEDLAKGLRARFEGNITLVGPLMEDYRHMARPLGQVFRRFSDDQGLDGTN